MSQTQITLQDFFDTTIRHLIQQGERAVEDYVRTDDLLGSVCRYRTPEGIKCAAGVHIPDALYEEWMEGVSILSMINPEGEQFQADLVPYFPSHSLAQALQELHDEEASWDDEGFIAFHEARDIAASHNLRWNFEQEAKEL